MLGAGYLFFFEAEMLTSIFAGEQTRQATEGAIPLLQLVAISMPSLALVIILNGALRGAGDTRFGLWLTLVAAWLVMVLPTWILVRYDLLTLHTGWIACTGFIVLLALGFLWRFLDGKWQSMTVLEPDLLPATESLAPEPAPKPPPMT